MSTPPQSPPDHQLEPSSPAPGRAPGQAPRHTRDRVPRFVLTIQAGLYDWLPTQFRLMLSIVIVVLAVLAALVLASSRLLQVIFEWLDIAALIGLFFVNWLGNGGALVPIPGARFVGLLLIFQQSVILPSWEVLAAAGAAMGLGLLSYYVAGARTAQSYAEGDEAGAQELAQQTGMLDDDAIDFAPGSRLDAEAVAAISGVRPTPADDAAAARSAATFAPSDAASARAAATAPDAAPGDAAAPATATPDGPTGEETDPAGRKGRLRRRFSTSLRKAQQRAEPILEQRGTMGMFLLCFAPTPLSTAGAYVGGLLEFGFVRFLLAAFSAKFLLAGIIVVLGLVFSGAAESVAIPPITIPFVDVTIFPQDG